MPTKQMKKEQVIKQALPLLYEQGLESTKMTEIASAAGCGVATVYRYFSTKDNFLMACGSYQWQQINEKYQPIIDKRIQASATAFEGFQALLNVYKEIFLTEPTFIRLIDAIDHYVIAHQLTGEILKDYEEQLFFLEPLLYQLYEKAKMDGSMAIEAPIDVFHQTVHHVLMAMAQKAVVRSRIVSRDEKNDFEKEFELLQRMVMRYVDTSR